MVEVSFSLAEKDGERPRIISGTIDLIFREKDGWVIADYKTDKVDGNLEALIAYHEPPGGDVPEILGRDFGREGERGRAVFH